VQVVKLTYCRQRKEHVEGELIVEKVFNDFCLWVGWTAVSSICQILIALLAFVAIIITISQIGNYKKISIGAELSLKIVNSSQCKGEKVIATVLEIYNLGRAPIFIKSCWLGFKKNTMRDTSDALILPIEKGFLQPGEYKVYANGIPHNIIDALSSKAKFESEMYVFLENGMGKTKVINCGMSYPKFQFEYNRLCKVLSTIKDAT